MRPLKLIRILFLCTILPVLITGCSKNNTTKTPEKKELLFYIGITMVKPVSELVNNFAKQNNCNITILQGGSQDLYNSLKTSKKGDLYLPGSYTYKKRNMQDGLLLDETFVGYNIAALFVQKGNPKAITSDLNQITDPRYSVVLCNPESGSIGRETQKILESVGIYKKAMNNTLFLTSDSRNITQSFIDKKADLSINWYATSFWDENRPYVDAILLDESIASRKKLVFNLLSFSENPDLSKKFMAYAASEEGQKIFSKYGFFNEEELDNHEMDRAE